MKRLSLYLFLILFTLQTPSLADDISDFQIEGMSIGDSLLDYLSKDKIKKIKSPNKKIKIVRAYKKDNLEIYDSFQLWWFDKDKDYKIVGIAGELLFNNDYKGCRKKQKEIAKSLKSSFPNLPASRDDENQNMHDKTGKSKTYHYILDFPNGDMINVQCYIFSEDFKKKNRLNDNLKVMMVTKIMNEHYRQADK